MKHGRALIPVLLMIAGLILLQLQGCGKKGDPVLPVTPGYQIAPPLDINLLEKGDMIELTWTHSIDEKQAFVEPEGFDVFLARLSFDDCEGCPFEFKKIGHVSAPEMRFTMKVEKGYRYYFRVQATGKDKLASEFTKTVLFEYR